MRADISDKGFVEGTAFDLVGHGATRQAVIDTDGCALVFRLGCCASFAAYEQALVADGCIIRSGASAILRDNAAMSCTVPGIVLNGIVTSGRNIGLIKPATLECVYEQAGRQRYYPCPEESGFALALQLCRYNRVFNNRMRVATKPFMVDEKPMLLGIEGGDRQLFAVRPSDGLDSPDSFWLFWDRSL